MGLGLALALGALGCAKFQTARECGLFVESIKLWKGQAPKGDSQFGVYVQVDQPVPEEAGRVFTASNYKVTDAP